MKNNASNKGTRNNFQSPIIPALTTIAIPLFISRGEKIGTIEQPSQEKAKKPKPKSTRAEKYEVSNYVLKFFVEKGLFKKRWVLIKEIPISEITLFENLGKELLVTWKGVTESFVIKNKGSSFSGLREQIQSLREEQQKNLEATVKANERKHSLAELIDASVCIVDLSFDMLMGLQVKPVNWANLEMYANSLTEKTCFTQQTLALLNLDFSKVTDAIKRQMPEEASKETFNVLNSIYRYFDSLKVEEDLEAFHPNIKDTKAAILACYTLNDLFLGKIVGEKDNQKEIQALEITLQTLSKDTNFKVTYQDLKTNLDRMESDAEIEGIIESSREILKEQLRNIDRPVKEVTNVQSLPEPSISSSETTPFIIQEIPISPKPQEPEQPQNLKPVIEPLEVNQPIVESKSVDQIIPELSQKPQESVQPTIPEELRVEPSPQTLVIEHQEPMETKTGEPEVQPIEPAQTDIQLPIEEEMKKTADLPPKKKGAARRLRKAIMGY